MRTDNRGDAEPVASRARADDTAIGLGDGEVVDARLAEQHQPALVEVPVLVAVAAPPPPALSKRPRSHACDLGLRYGRGVNASEPHRRTDLAAAPVRRGRGRPVGGQPLVDREVMLDAAERVITRDGNGAAVEAIAAEAGVTKPIVYARIGSRAELSNALAGRLAERLVVAARAEVTSSRLDRATLASFFRATFQTIGAHRELFLYVTRGSADDTSERTLYLAGTSAKPLADLLAHWRRRQGHDTAVAVPWAYGIIGMLNLVSLWWIAESAPPAGPPPPPLAELVWSGIGSGG